MRGRLLFNGNLSNPTLLAERIRPFLMESAPPGRPPRVLLVTAAWGRGEYGEGAVKAALNAVGVPSRFVGGYDRQIMNLCAWHAWQEYLGRRPDVAAVARELEAVEEATRRFYVETTAFHASRIRRAIAYARANDPRFRLGRLPLTLRQSVRPDAILSGAELLDRAFSRELVRALDALVENDQRMLATLDEAEEQVHARTGIRLDPEWQRARATLEERLLEADAILIFGGSPAALLGSFQFFDLRSAVLESLRRGALICAVSAGALLLCDRMIIYDNFNPDQEQREFRLFDRGLGLVGGLQVMPHCMDRIQTDDPDNLAYLARRFSTHVCVGLNEESFLLVDLAEPRGTSVGLHDGVYVFGPAGLKTRYDAGEAIPLH